MAELVDAADLKSAGRKAVWVRSPLPAPSCPSGMAPRSRWRRWASASLVTRTCQPADGRGNAARFGLGGAGVLSVTGGSMAEQQPFAGITVIEFGQFVSVPFCAQLLAEGGADVVKIEPLEGEAVRRLAPLAPGETRTFISRNRGKRSLPLNLRHPEAAAIIQALLADADVALMNFSSRPGRSAWARRGDAGAPVPAPSSSVRSRRSDGRARRRVCRPWTWWSKRGAASWPPTAARAPASPRLGIRSAPITCAR